MILLGTTWRSARSPTALQAQTLVLRAGLDGVTVDESVAADDGNYAAGGVANYADYVAVCSSEQLNNRFIHVGVDTSRYALLIGGRSSYPPCIS